MSRDHTVRNMSPSEGQGSSADSERTQRSSEDNSDTSEKSHHRPRKHRRGLTRTAAACERCRKRKQKCDSRLPTCGPCSASGATCVMSDRLVVHPSPKCNCDIHRRQVADLQSRIEALTIELRREKDLNEANQLNFYKAAENFQPELFPLPLDIRTQPASTDDSQPASKAYSGRILRPTFLGGSGQRGVDADVLGSAWQLWHNDTSTETPTQLTTSIEQVPLNEYGEDLINDFFDTHWAHLPILHRPTFMEQHYYPVSHGAIRRQFSEFQVYMVLAIAACERPRTSSGYAFSHRDFFQKAIQGLASVMASNDLDCVQSLLLLCMYGRNEPQSVNMWHTTGLAMRTALGIDLHRSESVANDKLFEAEMAKRLFWSAYVMDRSMAMAMGRPLGIKDSDITLPLPLQYTDEQLANADSHITVPFELPNTEDTSTFIHVIKIRRLNNNIYETFHSAGPSCSSEDLEALRLQYYGQLNDWLVAAPRYPLTTSMFQSSEWFQIAYHHAILSLHRPSNAIPVPSYEALRLCANSSISLISSYAALYAKNRVSYSFIALNSIFMSAITLLFALRASPYVREELTKAVMETNIATCLSLFRGISKGRAIAERCAGIVSRLGKATLALFDGPKASGNDVDMEFLSWFGLKSQHSSLFAIRPIAEACFRTPGQQDEGVLADYSTPSVDGAWRDFFAQEFDWEGSAALEYSPMLQ